MPIFQGFGRDKEKEEDWFFVSSSSSFKVVFMGKNDLEREEEITSFLARSDTFFILLKRKPNFDF